MKTTKIEDVFRRVESRTNDSLESQHRASKRDIVNDAYEKSPEAKRQKNLLHTSHSAPLAAKRSEKNDGGGLPSFLDKETLKNICSTLGSDCLTGTPAFVLASQAFRNSSPFYFIDITLRGDAARRVIISAHHISAEIEEDFPVSVSQFLQKMLEQHIQANELVESNTVMMLLPWAHQAEEMGSLEDFSPSAQGRDIMAAWAFDSPTEKPDHFENYSARGTAFLMHFHGVGVSKNEDAAKFLLHGLDIRQRRELFTETLITAAQYYHPDFLGTCVAHGGDIAPMAYPHEHLPLTFAVVGQKVENVQRLLELGADPRMMRDDGQGSALFYARLIRNQRPDFLDLLERYAKEKHLDLRKELVVVGKEWREIDEEIPYDQADRDEDGESDETPLT